MILCTNQTDKRFYQQEIAEKHITPALRSEDEEISLLWKGIFDQINYINQEPKNGSLPGAFSKVSQAFNSASAVFKKFIVQSTTPSKPDKEIAEKSRTQFKEISTELQSVIAYLSQFINEHKERKNDSSQFEKHKILFLSQEKQLKKVSEEASKSREIVELEINRLFNKIHKTQEEFIGMDPSTVKAIRDKLILTLSKTVSIQHLENELPSSEKTSCRIERFFALKHHWHDTVIQSFITDSEATTAKILLPITFDITCLLNKTEEFSQNVSLLSEKKQKSLKTPSSEEIESLVKQGKFIFTENLKMEEVIKNSLANLKKELSFVVAKTKELQQHITSQQEIVGAPTLSNPEQIRKRVEWLETFKVAQKGLIIDFHNKLLKSLNQLKPIISLSLMDINLLNTTFDLKEDENKIKELATAMSSLKEALKAYDVSSEIMSADPITHTLIGKKFTEIKSKFAASLETLKIREDISNRLQDLKKQIHAHHKVISATLKTLSDNITQLPKEIASLKKEIQSNEFLSASGETVIVFNNSEILERIDLFYKQHSEQLNSDYKKMLGEWNDLCLMADKLELEFSSIEKVFPLQSQLANFAVIYQKIAFHTRQTRVDKAITQRLEHIKTLDKQVPEYEKISIALKGEFTEKYKLLRKDLETELQKIQTLLKNSEGKISLLKEQLKVVINEGDDTKNLYQSFDLQLKSNQEFLETLKNTLDQLFLKALPLASSRAADELSWMNEAITSTTESFQGDFKTVYPAKFVRNLSRAAVGLLAYLPWGTAKEEKSAVSTGNVFKTPFEA